MLTLGPTGGGPSVSPAKLNAWRQETALFERLAAYQFGSANVIGPRGPVRPVSQRHQRLLPALRRRHRRRPRLRCDRRSAWRGLRCRSRSWILATPVRRGKRGRGSVTQNQRRESHGARRAGTVVRNRRSDRNRPGCMDSTRNRCRKATRRRATSFPRPDCEPASPLNRRTGAWRCWPRRSSSSFPTRFAPRSPSASSRFAA